MRLFASGLLDLDYVKLPIRAKQCILLQRQQSAELPPHIMAWLTDHNQQE